MFLLAFARIESESAGYLNLTITLNTVETFARFSVDQQYLYGMLHLPDELYAPRPTRGWPAVVVVHDYQSQRSGPHRLLWQLSRYLQVRGVASLRFDVRGTGDSAGDFSEMTVSRQVQDTLAAGEYLRHQPDLDPQRVMLLGLGLGAMVATLSAKAMHTHRLALWSPALPERWLPLLRGGFVPPTVSSEDGWGLGRDFLLELPRLKPLQAAQDFGGVARVFHGDADQVCPPEWGARYAQALECDALAIPGADHDYASLSATEQLLRVTGQFLLGE